MARYRIDDEAVCDARRSLDGDPATLRSCATALAAAGSMAAAAVGDADETLTLGQALQRFRLVHAQAVDAVADAAAALGGELDLAVAGEHEVQLAVASAFGAITASAASGGSTGSATAGSG